MKAQAQKLSRSRSSLASTQSEKALSHIPILIIVAACANNTKEISNFNSTMALVAVLGDAARRETAHLLTIRRRRRKHSASKRWTKTKPTFFRVGKFMAPFLQFY
jgi:hypothetical protein